MAQSEIANILPSVLIQNSVFWARSTADSSELGKSHLMLTEKQQALWEDISYSAWAYFYHRKSVSPIPPLLLTLSAKHWESLYH